MANQLISGQAENGRSFNVKVGEGGEGRQVTPPLDKIDRYYHFQAPSLLGKYVYHKQTIPLLSSALLIVYIIKNT